MQNNNNNIFSVFKAQSGEALITCPGPFICYFDSDRRALPSVFGGIVV